jgi:hypothetical protein
MTGFIGGVGCDFNPVRFSGLLKTVVRFFSGTPRSFCTVELFVHVIDAAYQGPTIRTIDARHTVAGPLKIEVMTGITLGAFAKDWGFSARQKPVVRFAIRLATRPYYLGFLDRSDHFILPLVFCSDLLKIKRRNSGIDHMPLVAPSLPPHLWNGGAVRDLYKVRKH